MEENIAALQRELKAVKNSRGGDEPGLVRLSDSQSVTETEGIALPARENNASINGTLANRIAAESNKRKNVFAKTFLQRMEESEGGSGFNWIVGRNYTMAERFDNFSCFAADVFWGTVSPAFGFYNTETDNLIEFAGIVAEPAYIRIKCMTIRYKRESLIYSIDSASLVDINYSGGTSGRYFGPGEMVDGLRIYGIGKVSY